MITEEYRLDEDGKLTKVNLSTGEVEFCNEDLPVKQYWTYSEAYCDIICKLLCEKTLSQICKLPGMPPVSVISYWRTKNPEFAKRMRESKKMLAETKYHDAIVDSTEIKYDDKGEMIPLDPRNVPVDKLQFDRLKWLARVNDPEVYGEKMQLSGNKDAPLQIVIDTGIRREEDKSLEANYEQIDEGDNDAE